MATTATVIFFNNEFVAALSDGRHLERHDWREMALALYSAGVKDNEVTYEWRSGQRMITAGQQVALRAEMRRLEHTASIHIVVAA
jgi:hypothetical protein